jgi:hypothetical protein
MGLCIFTKFQPDTIILTLSKVAVTEMAYHEKSIASIFFESLGGKKSKVRCKTNLVAIGLGWPVRSPSRFERLCGTE